MKRLILSLAMASMLTACQQVSTTHAGAVGATRKQSMLLSSQQVDQMSAASYAETIKKSASQGKLLASNDPTVRRVRDIAQRLIPQTAVFRPDALQWQWEVNVEKSPELNAYCMSGGKIMFYTGIIERLKLTDDEIAQIMGHEIAHALREHGREKMSEEYGKSIALQGGMQLFSIVTGGKYDAYQDLAGSGLNTLVDVSYSLPNSRTNESEADAMGLELAARAGFQPNAAVSLWQKMAAQGTGKGLEFMSTHPSSNTRIAELQAKIPVVMPLYEAAKNKPKPKPKKNAS
ncbi:M48 family metallopeptidase [Deefgea sp. CFH1-16]|uniref:M48 family metallopeptidase n=1 Tax=Deefgea sp. CFH1-16 TaxID=2675457 RepID=UPI0015F4BF46|nr:M48 family metallopeptidase [Deefgea sp. CFH1-16]MBM5574286.1 M48 family metalloprotease [Deefgea sp. CFH1-16]